MADPDPLVRMAAPRALSASASPNTTQAALALLRDPIRVVRTETARVVAGLPAQTMSSEQRSAFAAAYDELVAAELTNEDRPEAHLNLGLLHTRLAQPTEADAEYRTALRLDPDFVPALLNLADLDRMRGIDAQGEELLRKAMAIDPRNADVIHALGLSLVRQHNYADALPLLRQAAELAPATVRYSYIYAIALDSTGSSEQSRTVLAETHKQHPADRDVLVALIAGALAAGDFAKALSQLNPNDPQVKMLLSDLESSQTTDGAPSAAPLFQGGHTARRVSPLSQAAWRGGLGPVWTPPATVPRRAASCWLATRCGFSARPARGREWFVETWSRCGNSETI